MSKLFDLHIRIPREDKELLDSKSKSSGLSATEYVRRSLYITLTIENLEKQVQEIKKQLSHDNLEKQIQEIKDQNKDIEEKLDSILQNNSTESKQTSNDAVDYFNEFNQGY